MDFPIDEEEEDFLDEATVNPTGKDCPYALRMIAGEWTLKVWSTNGCVLSTFFQNNS